MGEKIKNKILVIIGPSASGKTSLSIDLAKKFNGEVISADSRQVYRGLDIGTEKIKKSKMQDIPHHLIDVCDPETVFSVQEFKDQASKAVDEIVARGNLPIIAGGTGFYINALLYDMNFPKVEPNQKYRDELETKSESDLYKIVQEKDPERAEAIDPHNKRRLIRALEVINALGKVPQLNSKTERYTSLIIGIQTSDIELKKRIEARLDDSLMNGLVQETLALLQSGVPSERINEFGLEYRVALQVIENKLGGDKMKEKMLSLLWKYVKRQRTWFKRNEDIVWLSLDEMEQIKKRVREFIK